MLLITHDTALARKASDRMAALKEAYRQDRPQGPCPRAFVVRSHGNARQFCAPPLINRCPLKRGRRGWLRWLMASAVVESCAFGSWHNSDPCSAGPLRELARGRCLHLTFLDQLSLHPI